MIPLGARFRNVAAGDEFTRQSARVVRRFRNGESKFDGFMRRVILKGLCRSVGNDLQIGVGVVLNPETMEYSHCVFIGSQ